MLLRKSKESYNYKFKSLKTYAWDRAIGNNYKFRSVFDRNEINYLSAEFSFYNKLFDEKDWDAKISIRGVALDGTVVIEEICLQEEEITIKKEQNIIRYYYGWGEEKYGVFWKKGKYRWIASINEKIVGINDFYIEDHGKVTSTDNPYFQVTSLRTYEAPAGDIDEQKREYLKTFDVKTTRFIMGEITFTSKIQPNWLCELFFNFYDDTGTLLGSSDTFGLMEEDKNTISAGYGAKDPGSWIEDNYRLEVVFMDTTVAVILFSVGPQNKERISEFEALMNDDVSGFFNAAHVSESTFSNKADEHAGPVIAPKEDKSNKPVNIKENSGKTLSEIMNKLDALIGLENIKSKVHEYVDYITFLQIRKEKGITDDDEISLHSVFTGNPGTGKTTVVKLLGEIFHAIGLLSKGHVYTVDANDLVSEYIRQTGKKTTEAIEKARGGILFIDEAYILYKKDSLGDFGPEAIAELITEMSDGKGDIAIMVAGYPNEMQSFLKSNPGLKSRFKHHFHFNDYTPDELLLIALYAAAKKNVFFDEPASDKIYKIITNAYRKRDKFFGNARYVFALVDQAKMNLGTRIVKHEQPEKLDEKSLSLIIEEDIEDIAVEMVSKKPRIQIDSVLLNTALEELNQLTGLENIKQEISELVRLTKYYREMKRDVLRTFSLHSIFTGNPGTGKTSVARILGKIYKALGLLERGHLIDADASSLIAGYIGQSALKTKELIEKANGGVLFIDEAYSLTNGRNNEFGQQAVAALIKEMEDQRGNFSLIVAGYTSEMESFIQSNPGLESRFDNKFEFHDFNENELWQIVVSMFKQKSLITDDEAEKHLKMYIAGLHKNRDRFFGNARSMRKIVEKAVRNQELRMADLPMSKRTSDVISKITLSDVQEFEYQKLQTKPTLGFKLAN
ncbi:AAA family ATPase [Maribellus comscasis]|uniref:AAA family ATPase n=1 Tax=Maribellus comscasis TaxID=2681766 RepID=A0A6I6K4E1_9BACT|nr:AAA family ATPase [Maribellus comscasis]QGY47497.1 AAA family ATPase [Maribellus comscasis]